jgi:hypothetical protein
MKSKTLYNVLIRLSRDYFSRKYCHYFVVEIPKHRPLSEVSEKLKNDYRISSHSQARQRRKEKGLANCNFVIYDNQNIALEKRLCVIVATDGEHETLKREQFLDIRLQPLTLLGNELFMQSTEKASVRIPYYRFKQIKTSIDTMRLHNKQRIVGYLYNLSKYSFSGIQEQKIYLMDRVNKKRKKAGLELIRWEEINRLANKNFNQSK